MNNDIYQIYNNAIKEQQQNAKPLSIVDEILAYRNQMAYIKQVEEQKRTEQMGFGKKVLHTAGDVFYTIGKGIAKGYEGILDASATLGANTETDQDMKDNLTRAIAKDSVGQSNIAKWVEGNTQGSYLNDTWVESALQSVGEMLPSVSLNAIPGAGQALSSASFIASASGRGTEQALNEGATLEQATKYGLTSGAVEGIIEMASGGIGGLGSGWLAKAFPKTAAKVSTKLMTKPIVQIGLSMVGEGFEEVASELIDPYMQRIYKSKEDIEPATLESITQAFTIGAIASGIMQGGMVKLTGKSSFKANLIMEQIENVNEKITQDVEKGTMTTEKAEIYKEQQEALLQQLESTLGANVAIKDNKQQEITPIEESKVETQPLQEQQIETKQVDTKQIETQTVPQETEKVIAQETKTQTLTEGLQETTDNRTLPEKRLADKISKSFELSINKDGDKTTYNFVSKTTNEPFFKEDFKSVEEANKQYKYWVDNDLLDVIAQASTRKKGTTTTKETQQDKPKQKVNKESKKNAKPKDDNSNTTKRTVSENTRETTTTVGSKNETVSKQQTTETKQEQVIKSGKEIYEEAKANKGTQEVIKNYREQTTYETIKTDHVPEQLQPLVERANNFKTKLTFYYEADNSVNAFYNHAEKSIYINLAGDQNFDAILTHELGHRQIAQNRTKFNEMLERYKNLSTETKQQIAEMFSVYSEFYKENYESWNAELEEQMLFEEFLCDVGAGLIDLNSITNTNEQTTLQEISQEFNASYLTETIQESTTTTEQETKMSLSKKPKIETPPVAESDTRNKVMVGNQKTKATFSDNVTWVKRAFTNSMADVEQFFKQNGVKNGEALANKARTARSVGANMITNGIVEVEIEGGKVTKITKKADSLTSIFSFTNNKSETYKQSFNDYLLHKHNVSRMKLPFEVNATSEEINILKQALSDGQISQDLFDTLTVKGNTTDILTVRRKILKHEQNMSQTTLDTILNMLGEQKPVFGEDVTAEDSLKQIKKYDQSNPEFAKHAEKVWQYNKALLDEQVKGGLVTQEKADYFNEIYPFYVPTHRVSKGASRSGTTQNTVQTGINKATGSDRVILDISEQMFNQTMKVSQAIAMNDMLIGLGNNAKANSEVELVSDVRITDISQIDMEDKGNTNRFTYFEIETNDKGEEILKRKTIQVSDGMDESIRSALPSSNNKTVGKGMNAVRKANVAFKKLTTSLNPFFSFIRNPLRDMQNALIYTKYGTKTFAKNYGRAIREMRNNGALYQAYQANGGEFSSYYNFEDSTKVNTERKGIGKYMHKMEQFSNFIEQVPRFAEFISSIEAGNTIDQAILDSADVTVNFSRSGIITKTANGTIMPYVNARMQGALKFVRSFEGIQSKQAQKQLAFVMARMVVLGIATSVLNDFLYDDDEEYKNLRAADKSNNFLIKVGNKFVKIPRAEITTALASAYNRSKEAKEGDTTAFKGFLGDVWAGFSPVQNMRIIFSPIHDARTNTTWYGSKIEGAKFDNVRPRDRYDESTSSIAKFIGQRLNISPKKVHYVLDQYSGILGDFILPATSQKYSTSVVAKNFTVDPTTSNKYSNRFYNELEEAQYQKTDGDMVAKGKVRFLNKAQDTLRELYNAQREINNDTKLSKAEKKEQVEVLQVLINNTQKNAIESLKLFSDTLSYFELADDTFDSDYREATRLVFGAETALMNYNKNTYAKAQELYNKGIPYDIFYCVYFDTKDMDGDFNYDGEYIRGSKQVQVWNYINALNISKTHKEALYEALGYKVAKTNTNTNTKNPFKAYGAK